MQLPRMQRAWWFGTVGVIGFLTSFWFWWQGTVGFSLWDEGFLWYGVQRIHAGDLPIRDFFGYDIGRYLLLAFGANIWGSTGLVGMRFGLTMMHALVLLAVIGVMRIEGMPWRWVPVVGAVTTLWAWPLYRMPDMVIAVGAVFVLSSIQRWWKRGSWVYGASLAYGLLAIGVGDLRKHVMFFGFGVAMIAVMWLIERKSWRDVLGWGWQVIQGLATGMMPLLGFALARPEFRASYWQHMVVGFLQRETPNIPLPYPWAWQLDWAAGWHPWLVGVVFTVFVIGGPLWLLGMFWATWRGWQITNVVRASVVLIPPYITYVLSRADLAHLTQGVLVMMCACIAVAWRHARGWQQGLMSIVLVGISAAVMLPVQPAWECRQRQDCRDVVILDDTIHMPGPIADEVALIQQFGEAYLTADTGSVYVIPFWPGAYSVLNTRAPVWEIYAIWPRDEAFQAAEIARLEAAQPVAVLLKKEGLDGDEALRFRNTHPMMYDYLREQYRPVTNFTLLPGYTIMERRK